MAFHPKYWNRMLKNSSKGYNYYKWNLEHRGDHVGQFLKEDPRPLPKPTEPVELDPQLRLIVPAGGVILFSGAQMHSSVPNTSGKTRFSIDFRVVNLEDVASMRGASHTDEECTGTTMRDYLRATDLAHIPENLVALYDDETTNSGNSCIYTRRDSTTKVDLRPSVIKGMSIRGKEVVALLPAAGRSRRLAPLPCSKEMSVGGSAPFQGVTGNVRRL